MKKIPTLFVRDPENRKHVLPEVTPGCEWVLAGEGTATRKYDGTCVMFDGQHWWARREVKPGKLAPHGWVQEDEDLTTGKRMGWEPIAQSSYAGAFSTIHHGMRPTTPGTYELCGPKVQGNPEGLDKHELIEHATAERIEWADTPTVEDLFGVVPLFKREGIVWHHPDGRMAKLKVKDFPKRGTGA